MERRKNRNKTKLSYKDQRELDQLPVQIDELESRVAEFQAKIATPEFYSQDQDAVQEVLKDLRETEALLEQCVDRWGELESGQASP